LEESLCAVLSEEQVAEESADEGTDDAEDDGHHRRPPRARSAVGLDWPGRGEGLSDRESEILALITQGKSNADVAELTYLSPNTIKSYIRTIYRKIGVASHTQAVLWGVHHGFTPDHNRIEHWKGGRRRFSPRLETSKISGQHCAYQYEQRRW
jgi:DNA-binding NarL/FixJ family response regulator